MINDEYFRVDGDGSMIISNCFDDMIEYCTALIFI